MRPELPDGLLPVFVLDRYEGLEARLLQDFTDEERRRYVEANAAALRELLPGRPRLHEPRADGRRRSAPASGVPFRVKAHGSELEYSMRGRPELEAWGPSRSRAADAVYVGSAHIREVLEEVAGHVERVLEVPPGVDVDEFVPQDARRGARRACSQRRAPTRRTPATRRSGCRTRATPTGSRRSSPTSGPIVVYFGKLIVNKGVHLLLEALERTRRARGDRRLRRLPRRARARARRPTGVLFTGPLEHRHLVHLLPLADAAVVPSIFPEAFGMVAAEAAASGCPPLVARHSGLAEVAAGLEAEYPPAAAPPGRVRERRRGRPAREAARSCSRCRPPTARRCARPRARRAVEARWSWAGVAARLLAPVA